MASKNSQSWVLFDAEITKRLAQSTQPYKNCRFLLSFPIFVLTATKTSQNSSVKIIWPVNSSGERGFNPLSIPHPFWTFCFNTRNWGVRERMTPKRNAKTRHSGSRLYCFISVIYCIALFKRVITIRFRRKRELTNTSRRCNANIIANAPLIDTISVSNMTEIIAGYSFIDLLDLVLKFWKKIYNLAWMSFFFGNMPSALCWVAVLSWLALSHLFFFFAKLRVV